MNNVLCFPFIFRGALDVGATTITDQMKLAAVRRSPSWPGRASDIVVAAAYGEKGSELRPRYIIPKPFDPRLIVRSPRRSPARPWSPGVATRRSPISTPTGGSSNNFVWQFGPGDETGLSGRQARQAHHSLEARSERVLRAVRQWWMRACAARS